MNLKCNENPSLLHTRRRRSLGFLNSRSPFKCWEKKRKHYREVKVFGMCCRLGRKWMYINTWKEVVENDQESLHSVIIHFVLNVPTFSDLRLWMRPQLSCYCKETQKDLIGDGAGIFHRHHQISSQEVHQDVGDIGAHSLQDVLGDADLGFICTNKQHLSKVWTWCGFFQKSFFEQTFAKLSFTNNLC